MTRGLKLAAATLALMTCFVPEAGAQTVWTSADGGLRFTPPAGWVRHEPPKGSDVALVMAQTPDPSGAPGVSCKVKIKQVGPTQPGYTQAMLNDRLQAGAGGFTIDEKRVATNGGITTLDGFLAIRPRIMMVFRAFYVRGGILYDASAECGRQKAGELTLQDLQTARVLFDAVSVTP